MLPLLAGRRAQPLVRRPVVADRDLMDLKVTQLKDELKERGEKRTGNKAWLRCGGCTVRCCASTSPQRRRPAAPHCAFTILGRSAGPLPADEKSTPGRAFTTLIGFGPTFTLSLALMTRGQLS